MTGTRLADTAVRKRSLSIAGHATSVSLEDPFWEALQDIAAERGCPLAALVTEVDAARTPADGRAGLNLSSALRVFVLTHYRDRSGADPRPPLTDPPPAPEH